MRITTFVRQNAKALLTLVALLCGLGGYFAVHLPVAIFPQLTVPRIAIEADAGDIPISTTLAQVTRPLETAVSTVPGVTRVASTTARGSDSLDVTFADGTDMQATLQRVQSQIAAVQPTLPAGATVGSAVINPSVFPIMGYSLTSDTLSLAGLRQLALYTIRPQLARLPGVAQIRVTGGDTPEYVVAVRPDALTARGLTLADVQDALAKANGVSAVGEFDRSEQRYQVLVTGTLTGADDIRRVAIVARNRIPILVSDVADVRATVARRTVLATGDGHPGVVLNVVKQPDANTIQVASEIHAAIAGLTPTLPKGIHLARFYDQSDIVSESESSVVESIIVGGVLALVVLMLFLGNLRVAAIVLIQLPLTLLITFSAMRLLGQTLNIMTLGALAIAMGMVIDDGIVVVENVYHELEQGKTRAEAVGAGMQSITSALIGSSLTTMVTFLPLTFLGGVTGQFFAPLAWVMIATLAVSLLLALLFTPLLCSFILPRRVPRHSISGEAVEGDKADPPTAPAHRGAMTTIFGFFPRLFDYVAAGFAHLLLACFRFRWLVLLLSVGALIGGYVIYGRLETGFFPEFDEGAFVLDYVLPSGTSLAESDRVASEIEKRLGETPEVEHWSRLTGALSGSGLELTGQNQGDILVLLKSNHARPSDEIMDDLRGQITGAYPGVDADFAQILQDGIGDIAGTPSPIEVKIYGPDTQTLVRLAHAAGQIVTTTPGVVDEKDGIVQSGPEMNVRVDSQRAAQAGLTTEAVTAAATAALQGTVATTIQQGEVGIPVRVQSSDTAVSTSPASDTSTPNRLPDTTTLLPNLPIAAPSVPAVPLRSVATLTVVPGSPQITRENQQAMVAVTARLEGRDLGSGVRDVQARLTKQLQLPSSYRIEFGGLYASQQQSFLELATVLVVAVLLVSTMLLVQLREFRQSFALLVAAILSLGGVLLSLYLTRTPLNLSSFTGAIMVVGIITEDGIVFFDVVNHLRRVHPEHTLVETILEARRLRLRPILMTILAAILALLPLALGVGAGAAMQKPLAIAVIGGLLASTVFTLLVAPTVYVTLAGKRQTASDIEHVTATPSPNDSDE